MGDGLFQVGDRVSITAGAFAAMPGIITSESEVVARWPDKSPDADVDTGVSFWVVVRIYSREVPVVVSEKDLALA